MELGLLGLVRTIVAVLTKFRPGVQIESLVDRDGVVARDVVGVL